jgi:DNA repair exonuclease SbcCD nuclease subunit
MELIGIGDLHLDKLTSLIPDSNSLMVKSLKRVYKYALERGVQHVIHYGDVSDKPKLSDDAVCLLIPLLLDPKYENLHFHFILGNHDFAEDSSYSLRWLEKMALALDRNITVYSAPTQVKLDDVKFNMLPYPFTETLKDHINIGHFEVAGSTRDNGRKIDEGPDTKHVCLLGHLHTPHRVRNSYFSGTLAQMNFGESMPKFFHHVTTTGPKDLDVQYVPFKPPWELINLVVRTPKDLRTIDTDERKRYKLFIHDGADIDINDVYQRYPNVDKSNVFKTKTELTTLVQQTWEFDTDQLLQAVNLDETKVVKSRLKSIGYSQAKIDTALSILRSLNIGSHDVKRN